MSAEGSREGARELLWRRVGRLSGSTAALASMALLAGMVSGPPAGASSGGTTARWATPMPRGRSSPNSCRTPPVASARTTTTPI